MSLRERTPWAGDYRTVLAVVCEGSAFRARFWIHEIKHDGFRILARRDSAGVRLITRNGNDFTSRFPLAADAVVRLPSYSFLLDGEAIVTNDRGLAVFDLIRHKHHGEDAVLIAFDLIELDGEENPNAPAVKRKVEEDWGRK